ncbi:MAG: DUF2079 domain-containing protein [Ardenticatenaceae bacterium]
MNRLHKQFRLFSFTSPSDSFAGWLLVAILAGLWALLLSRLAIAQHESFSNIGNDLGIYSQLVWTTAHGPPFYTSLTRYTTNFLGHHFVPLLAILAPFYRLWPDARLLLVAQAIMLAAGAFPLFAFARRRLSRAIALLMVVVYFLSPFLAFIALFEFHEISLAVPLLMAAGAGLLDKRPRATLLWLLLALLVKEEVALIAIGFGFYALFVQRRWRFGAGLTVAALAWTLFLFGWLMPSLNQLEGNYTFVERYASLGHTPTQIILTLLTTPATVVALLTSEAKQYFVYALLLPLGGLPLLGLPATLLTLPTLAYLMLSDYELQVEISKHYSAPILPFLYLSTVIALERLQKWKMPGMSPRSGAWAGGGFLLLAALFGAYTLSPLPGGANYSPNAYEILPEHAETEALLATIPPEANVASDWRYLPWLANRRMIDDVLNPTFRPINTVVPDFIVTKALAPDARQAPHYPWIAPELSELDDSALRLPRYTLQEISSDGTMVWVRRPTEQDLWLRRYNVPFERGMILVAAGTPPEAPTWGPEISATPGSTLPIWLAWGAATPLEQRISFTMQMFRDDERVAQVDKEMGSGHFPTTHWHDWLEQPVVVDQFDLHLPPDLPPGRYRLLTGAYETETITPLLQPDGNGWVELTTVVIGE